MTSAPADIEVIEEEVPLLLVTGFDVMSGEVAGYEVVILVMEVDGGDEKAVLTFALPSEDGLQIARNLISVASTVRPFQIQQRIDGLTAGKESGSK